MIITTKDTAQIQQIIDSCSQTGEEIVFEKGVYKTATIILRNNTHIVLKKGAMILGTEDFESYTTEIDTFTDAVNRKRGQCLIYAQDVSDISITGDGIINGNGALFHGEVRPFLMRIVRSKNVHLEGIGIHDSGAWNIHLMDSEDIFIKDLFIKSKVNSNNDAIDIDACRRVRIEDCIIDTGDDAICLKTTVDKPCTDVYVTGCTLSTDWAAIKVGTESVGDFENITIENCHIYNCLGCAIKIVPVDGGNLKNLTIQNITLDNSTGPIFISNGERLREYHGFKRIVPSTIENVLIQNIKGTTIDGPERTHMGQPWGNAKSCICISGTDSAPVKNVKIANIEVVMTGGVTEYEEAPVPPMGDRYPEFHNFGILPAWGVYARNVAGLETEGIDLTLKNPDIRKKEVYENMK